MLFKIYRYVVNWLNMALRSSFKCILFPAYMFVLVQDNIALELRKKYSFIGSPFCFCCETQVFHIGGFAPIHVFKRRIGSYRMKRSCLHGNPDYVQLT